MTILVLLGILFLTFENVSCGCVVNPPLNQDSPQVAQIGLIFVPGATIPGERYLPLMEAVQAHYPGGLWVAATTQWPNDSPNPVVIGDQMAECLTAAADLGLNTENVFFAGHSLGGVVLESWVRTGSNAELTKGIALLGTWLPNLLGRRADVRSNEYPVPVLTAIGELDGGGLSYLIREVGETQALPSSVTAFSKTIYVPQVNHAQVASGEVDQGVTDNDIDAEIPEADAHENYGIRMSDWLSLNALHLGLLTQAQAQPALLNFAQYEADTQEFLAPFAIAAEMEQVGYTSEMVRQSQMVIIGEEYLDNIEIQDTVLTNEITFQGYKPSVTTWDNGTTLVKTWSHMLYDLDPLDFNMHLSARTVKAKMKLADYIYEEVLGMEGKDEVLACSELNRRSLEFASSIASESALVRMAERGRVLSFGSDKDGTWGLGLWELSGGLQWNIVDEANVELVGYRLWSNPGFPVYPGEHYCDLLSPYRALEWIYIESIRHKMQF